MEELVLQNIPLFAGLDRVDLAKLIPELERVSIKAGEILFHQGDQGDSLYIILRGTAKIYILNRRGVEHTLAYLGPGECVGEMALLTGAPRSASVRAETGLIVLKLSRDRFNKLISKHHFFAVHLTDLLSRRLRLTNEEFAGNSSAQTVQQPAGEMACFRESETGLDSSVEAMVATANRPIKSYVSNKFVTRTILGIIICIAAAILLQGIGLPNKHIIISELLLAATLCWSFNLLSFRLVSVSMPVAAVLLGVADPTVAFSGYSSPSFFLVLGVFAIAASIARTGLMYRAALQIIRRFPPSYIGQTLALALTGLLLTPVIPSSNGRATLAGPLALNLSEALGFKNYSPGSVGMGMACLLGYGHMSFMFMNGTSTCLLVLGLLPGEISSYITWWYWLQAALPMGILFFILSYFAILVLYHPGEKIVLNYRVVDAQLKTLGPVTGKEVISLATVVFTLVGFITQPLHHIHGAWVAMLAFLFLFGSSVLDEKSIQTDIDWNFLISFGAVVGFGSVVSSSGLTGVIAKNIGPVLQEISANKVLFLLVVSLLVNLIRFILPLPSAVLVSMLSILPVLPATGINPFVIGLVVLISSNPWFLPSQNNLFSNIFYGMEERAFHHRQTLKLAYAHVVITLVAIILSVPYWAGMGLIK